MTKKNLSLLITASVFILSSCNIKTTEEIPDEKRKVLVEIKTTKVTSFQNELSFTGVVQPWEEAFIGAATPARIEKIYVDVGDKVTKGQLVVQMDRTHLFQAKVQRDNLKNDLSRLEILLKEGAVTRQNYDQLKAQFDVAESNYNNLAVNTEIKSTLTGVVTGRFFSDGEIFSMTPTPAGKPGIIAVKQIDPVKIIIGVSERYFTTIKEGQKATIYTEILNGEKNIGTVYRIHPSIDRASGTFQVEIRINNPDHELLPGMFTRVKINLGETKGIIVPAISVLKQVGSNERFVFVVEDDKAVRRTVKLGRKLDDNFEIVSGLKEGENLVVLGQHNLTHNDEVEIVRHVE